MKKTIGIRVCCYYWLQSSSSGDSGDTHSDSSHDEKEENLGKEGKRETEEEVARKERLKTDR